jgi:putative ABC transport system permease protein
MFRYQLKIALRNILRHKISSFINIAGMGVGLAATVLLYLYIVYEKNYDRQFRNAENVYQVMTNTVGKDNNIVSTIKETPNVLFSALHQEVPEIQVIARITKMVPRLVKASNNSYKINGRAADDRIFEVIKYEFLSGNAQTALRPGNIVLTESIAKKLFGTIDVINQVVKYENQVELKVAGVVKDLPKNITYGFDCLISWKDYETLNDWVISPNWENKFFYTLLTLRAGANVDAVNKKVGSLVANHAGVNQSNYSIFIYPLTELYLHGEFLNGKPSGGRISQLQIFISLALGILCIACINFINLSTARSQKRAKEIGVKKTLGATQMDLKIQFLSEFMILTIISVFLGLLIVELSLPWFNAMLDTKLAIDYLNISNWIFFLVLIAVTTLLAGGYPAFVLASMDTIKSLKGRAPRGTFALSIRKMLVVIQFGFSLIVIVATIIIYQQLHFLKNKPLGYDVYHLVQMPHEGNLYFKFELLKDRLLASGAIRSICQSSGSVALENNKPVKPEWDGMGETDKSIAFDQIYTTYGFVKTTGIKMISGHDFSKDRSSDQNGLLINETAVKTMGLQDPIGKRIRLNGEPKQVIGVFKDIVWGDPATHSKPMIVAYNAENSDFITMRLNNTNELNANIEKITSIIKELNPDFPVDITFVDELVAAKYRNEQTMASISNIFGGFSIFLSCLGLFALSAFSAELRTKEIGIRKVLGASRVNLIALLSMDFLKIVLIAIVIAIIPSFLIMSHWLDNFDYHISIKPTIFIFSGIGILLIAFLTVAWHSFVAANKNPVETLKYE